MDSFLLKQKGLPQLLFAYDDYILRVCFCPDPVYVYINILNMTDKSVEI